MISGFVGLVAIPDDAGVAAAYALAEKLLPADAENVLRPPALPHVTLSQCPLRDAAPARLAALVAGLDARLRGQRLPLRNVLAFGGGFAFWCVDDASNERALLQHAHEDALALSEVGLDPQVNTAVVEATARLTGNDAALVRNARRYGYAFAADRYVPHVTLGFDPRLARTLEPGERPCVMRVAQVTLARLGRYGVVEDLVRL